MPSVLPPPLRTWTAQPAPSLRGADSWIEITDGLKLETPPPSTFVPAGQGADHAADEVLGTSSPMCATRLHWTVGEFAFGLHTASPIKAAERERRYREVLATYMPIPYDGAVAHWFGAIAAAVQRTDRNPRARTIDLMIAATARHVGAVVLTQSTRRHRRRGHRGRRGGLTEDNQLKPDRGVLPTPTAEPIPVGVAITLIGI